MKVFHHITLSTLFYVNNQKIIGFDQYGKQTVILKNPEAHYLSSVRS